MRRRIHQAAHAVVWRPCGHRECHRLLVHLRRQPADHAVLATNQERARAGLVELVVRRQRRIRTWLRFGLDQPRQVQRAHSSSCAGVIGERTVRRAAHGRSIERRAASSQRARALDLRRALSGRDVGRRQASRRTRRPDLVKKSVWIVGGDGWAYDIGFGGLDHVLASGRDVNILVLDTEVYSNTAVSIEGDAARCGREVCGSEASQFRRRTWGCSRTCMARSTWRARGDGGAKMPQTVRRSSKPKPIPGPSLIIAYSHCIAHGYDMAHGAVQQKLAVESGVWPLYRFDPRRTERASRRCTSITTPEGACRRVHAQQARFRVVERCGSRAVQAVPETSADRRTAAVCGLPPCRHHRAAGQPAHTRCWRIQRGRRRARTHMDLKTEKYLGLSLPHPLIAGPRRSPTTSTPSSASRIAARPPSSFGRSSKSRSP